MSSSVTARTWFHVSLGALRSAADPPLLCIKEQRLLKLLTDTVVTKEEYRAKNGSESEMNGSSARSSQAETGQAEAPG
jgi:hypothetical protein